jgi:hypothetical protein
MTKVASAYYATAVGHKQIDGIYLGTFAVPGEAPQWVTDDKGRPKHFRSANEAELAGFKMMMARLNRARQEQSFHVKGSKPIKSWTAPAPTNEPTVESVFGKK